MGKAIVLVAVPPGLTAMAKHADHVMTWYDHGDSFSPWYDHCKNMAWSSWDVAWSWYGRHGMMKNSKTVVRQVFWRALTYSFLFFRLQRMGCLNDPGSIKDAFRHRVSWSRLLGKSLKIRVGCFQCLQKTDHPFEKKTSFLKSLVEKPNERCWDFSFLALIIGLHSALQVINFASASYFFSAKND